jgi:hypothetical protein
MDAAAAAVLRRFWDGIRLRSEARDMITRAHQMRSEGTATMERARDAADLLGFDLDAAFSEWMDYLDEQAASVPAQTIDEAFNSSLAPSPSTPTAAERVLQRPTVREFILSEAQAAYPSAVRAADLRHKYEDLFAVPVHEKTFGMTLYRISQKTGRVRREGHADWFFVPPEDEQQETLALTFSKGDGNVR